MRVRPDPRAALLVLLIATAGCASPAPLPSSARSPAAPGASTEGTSRPEVADWSGLAWQDPVDLPAFDAMSDIGVTAEAIVAVGQIQAQSGSTVAAAWTSADARTWHRAFVDRPELGSSSIHWLRATALGLVAIGSSGVEHCVPPEGEGQVCDPLPIAIWTSADGMDWTPATFPGELAGFRPIGVGSDGRELILAGDRGWNRPELWSSTGGLGWDRIDLPQPMATSAHLEAIRATVRGWILTGSTGGSEPQCCVGNRSDATPAAWWSSDGRTWHTATITDLADHRGDVIGPIFEGSDGLAAWSLGDGNVARGWTSADGRTWSANAASDRPVNPVTSDGTRIVGTSFGDGGTLAVAASRDGRTWTPLPAMDSSQRRPAWTDGPTEDAAWLFRTGVLWLGQDVDGAPLEWWSAGVP